MDLSCGHFYKTIEEAETAIKQYSKEHYFIRLIRPRWIKKIYSSGIPLTNQQKLFVGNRPRRIKKTYASEIVSDELKNVYSSGIVPDEYKNFICRDFRRITMI